MSAVALRPAAGWPPRLGQLPAMLPRLDNAVSNFANGYLQPVSPDTARLAREHMQMLEPLLAPAAPDVIRAFMGCISMACRHPPSAEEFENRVAMLILARGRSPAAIWCEENLRIALTEFKIFPSVAEVCEIANGQCDRLTERMFFLPKLIAMEAEGGRL